MNDPDQHDWRVIPGRRACHAFVIGREGRYYAKCGLCDSYRDAELAPAAKKNRRCEQCQMAILCGSNTVVHKFFVGYVTARERSHRRKIWREYLRAQRAGTE